MTETATPATPETGTPAAPVTTTETSAAPAATAAPAAPVAPAVTPTVGKSLLDSTTTPPAVTPPVTTEPAATNEPEWFYANGVKGTGKPPDWYKVDKYKTVDEQARAYAELEKKFGGFTGAPKDGKYTPFALPEELKGVISIQPDHPLFVAFDQMAAKTNMSQDTRDALLSLHMQYEASQLPDLAAIKTQIGPDADARINAVTAWGKANLGDDYESLANVMAGHNAADVFKVVEGLIKQTRQAPMPRAGADSTASTPPSKLKQIEAMQAELGPDGKRLMETSSAHRAKVDKALVDYYQGLQTS